MLLFFVLACIKGIGIRQMIIIRQQVSTMKAGIFFLIALSACAVGTQADLQVDLSDFWALIPDEKLAEILLRGLDDPEVYAAYQFLFSDAFAELLSLAIVQPEVQGWKVFLIENGLDVEYYAQRVRDFLGIGYARAVRSRGVGGVRGFLDEIIAVIPLSEIRALAAEKLETSPAFARIHEAVRSDEFRDLAQRVRANPTVDYIIQRLEDFGVDLARVRVIINYITGWSLE